MIKELTVKEIVVCYGGVRLEGEKQINGIISLCGCGLFTAIATRMICEFTGFVKTDIGYFTSIVAPPIAAVTTFYNLYGRDIREFRDRFFLPIVYGRVFND